MVARDNDVAAYLIGNVVIIVSDIPEEEVGEEGNVDACLVFWGGKVRGAEDSRNVTQNPKLTGEGASTAGLADDVSCGRGIGEKAGVRGLNGLDEGAGVPRKGGQGPGEATGLGQGRG